MQELKIFISSPGDVGQERLLSERVIARLQGEFAAYFELQPIFWEDKPMEASQHFQNQIAEDLFAADIVICILWQRLGTRLPPSYTRADGSQYDSGTEWEFETAIGMCREHGKPTVLVYKKTKRPDLHLYETDERMQREKQLAKLNEFWLKWFGDHQAGFKAAYTSFENAENFEERLEVHLREILKKKVPAVVADDEVKPSWFRGSPYRGLEVFGEEHASVFFGRTKAISEIKDCLIRQAAGGCSFLLVLGRSGCGKSSLVRAGVIPTLTHPGVVENIDFWRYAVYRPGDYGTGLFRGLTLSFAAKTAFGALTEEETASGVKGEEVIAWLKERLAEAATEQQAKSGLSRMPQGRILLYIDQFEELFANERYDQEERRAFLELLERIACSGVVWVLTSMRSDLYGRCCEEETLIRLKAGAGQYDLLPPSFAEIGAIIQKPTHAAGLRFEKDTASGQTLDDALHEVAASNPSALPLLEFTLAELYKRRAGNVLTFAAYRELGGMEGALAFYAESAFAKLSPEVKEALPGLMRLLVSIEREEEKMISNRLLLRQIEKDRYKLELVRAFVEDRLLVSDNTPGGEPMVGVAHEALLRSWPRVQQWLQEERSFLRSRAWLNEEASNWLREERRVEYLLAEGKPLENGRDALLSYKDSLNPLIIEYVETSMRKAITRKRRRRTFLAALTAMLFCLGFAFLRTSWGDKMVEFRHHVETIIEGSIDIAIAEKFDKIDNRIAFLDIDDAVFKEWGRPFITPRDKIADLLEMLDNAGAKIIVFDIFFDEPDHQHPEKDARLRQSLQKILARPDGPQIVFPTTIYHDGTRGKNIFDDLIDDEKRFFRGVPYILVKSDYDYKIRYWSPYGLCRDNGGGKSVLWGTPLLTAALATGDVGQLKALEKEIVKAAERGGNAWQKQNYALLLHDKKREVPTSFSYEGRNEQQKIKYYMIPKGAITPEDPGNLFMQSIRLSDADRMLTVSKNIFRNKIVIVGNSAPDKGDDKQTPVGKMPGMYVIGNVINNIIKGP